jgi:hypothetical protein
MYDDPESDGEECIILSFLISSTYEFWSCGNGEISFCFIFYKQYCWSYCDGKIPLCIISSHHPVKQVAKIQYFSLAPGDGQRLFTQIECIFEFLFDGVVLLFHIIDVFLLLEVFGRSLFSQEK